MRERSQYQQDSLTAVQPGILQRKCATCGTRTIAGDKCEECKNKQGFLQRKSSNNYDHAEAPPIVREVLSSSGQPLDASTQTFFESRFAHDFSGIPISSTPQQISQSSLTIGKASDVYEQEADRIADSVMLNGNKNTVLAANEQPEKERSENFDLSHVRIHTDSKAAESAQAINAQAYTVGSSIVFGAGQFAPETRNGQHLIAHELAHVAQQTNSGRSSAISRPVRRNVIQRQVVPTGFGEFNTTEFKPAEDKRGKGVNITLIFDPDKKKVNAKKIALSQSIKNTTPGGINYALGGVTKSDRMVPSGRRGGGYSIDAPVSTNNPIFYDTKTLGASEELKDTPEAPSKNNPDNLAQTLLYEHYKLGYSRKENPEDKENTKQPALLRDTPRGWGKGHSQEFETVAFAIEGDDKDKYYGSVKWGYKLEGTDAAPTITPTDITLASPGKGKNIGIPTENFTEAAKLWNAGISQGTLRVLADIEAKIKLTKGTKIKQIAAGTSGESPYITVKIIEGVNEGFGVNIKKQNVEDSGGSNEEESQDTLQTSISIDVPVYLSKGTKIKQDNTGIIGETPYISAKILDGDYAGIVVDLKNTDVEDMGDGLINKKLPGY